MATRGQQQQKFLEDYNRLNPEQKKAVDTIDGPVMVIAGPGTGKTQILSARIGKILLETDTRPENILCLTYTDAGVVAMRKRLLQFIGPDAYKVHLYTFHAFCNDVIQDNLSLFEKTSLDAISDLEKMDLFRQLIDGFPKNHPLKRYRGDVYYEVRNLDSLFSTMKREGWAPQFITQKVDEYLADMPNREKFIYKRAYKQFKSGDLKEDKINEEKERMEKLKAAVNEFPAFQQMMRAANRYDFDDMINWVIDAFEKNPALLSRYQEQFLYILVDEYQDTSGTQNRLVELLINYWEQPNIFVVGDDDQSIYRFQGANIENMWKFADNYKKDLLTVVLTNNYRSIQSILNVSKSLIDRNKERMISRIENLTKDLLSANLKYRDINRVPAITEYETQRQEMIDITLQIEKLLEQNIPAGKIAVIFKENKYGEELQQYLKLRNVPYYSKRSLNMLQIPLVQKLVTLLEYLSCEHEISFSGDPLLFELLHFDWFGIAPIEIAKLSIESSSSGFGDNKKSFRRLLYEKAHAPAKDLFSQTLNPSLQKASRAIEDLVEAVPNMTLQMLVEKIIRKANVLSTIMRSPDKHWELKVLTDFFDFIKTETARKPEMELKDLIVIFQLMQKENLSLPVVQVSGTDKGVNLLTAHGSKGLEYEHVFFASCNACFWEKKRKFNSGYTLPDTLFTSAPSEDDNEEELRRLFYVALTRAEQHLHISYHRFKNDGKEEEPSRFIAEILEEHEIEVEKIVVDTEVQSEFAALQFEEGMAPEIEKLESDYITRILEKFTLNVTALNNYLNCPLQFYFQNLVRIPSPKNEATEFGSAVHHALEHLFRKMQLNNETFPPVEEFLSDFDWYMKRHRENFTAEQYNRRIEYGYEVLKNYYANYIDSWKKIVAIERNIRNVTINDVPVKGKLDKLEFDGKMVNVVDYKSGDPDKAVAKLRGPNEKDPNGGDYWRQAVFYKLLVDNYEQRGWKVLSSEFDFIEPDKKKNYRKIKVVITPEDVTTVIQQITDTWKKIQDRDFYTGCGKEDCHWCNFVKTNNMAVELHEVNMEEEES
ncbi:MAG: ATP-dependent helicase [Chitinophagaceae bacterium]|nr:ATP-dependent helicase [Chitinophagaceae bacterium]